MTYNATMGHAPAYLNELVTTYAPARSLRTGNDSLLTIPHTSNRAGDHSFRVYGPWIWNDLPGYVRAAKYASTFKKLLKTHYFNIALMSSAIEPLGK